MKSEVLVNDFSKGPIVLSAVPQFVQSQWIRLEIYGVMSFNVLPMMIVRFVLVNNEMCY